MNKKKILLSICLILICTQSYAVDKTDPWYERWHSRWYPGRLLRIGDEAGYQRYYAFTEDRLILGINVTNSFGIEKKDIKCESLALRTLVRTTMKEDIGWSFGTKDGIKPLCYFLKPTMKETIDLLCKEANHNFDHSKDFNVLFTGLTEDLGLLGRILEYCYVLVTKDDLVIVENIVSIWPYECWYTMPCY